MAEQHRWQQELWSVTTEHAHLSSSLTLGVLDVEFQLLTRGVVLSVYLCLSKTSCWFDSSGVLLHTSSHLDREHRPSRGLCVPGAGDYELSVVHGPTRSVDCLEHCPEGLTSRAQGGYTKSTGPVLPTGVSARLSLLVLLFQSSIGAAVSGGFYC